jgi:Raf kinase inhibitor-like YbhB/YbcL family protein
MGGNARAKPVEGGIQMKKALLLSAFILIASVPASAFELSSNLKANETIPPEYYADYFGCTAQNQSPMLEWKDPPAGTKSFALTFYDHDAPTGSGFWHYLLYDIPVGTTKIEMGALAKGQIPAGSKEGNTDVGKPGFKGPCPPIPLKDRYTYTIFALKTEKLGVPDGATSAITGFYIHANSIGEAKFDVFAGPRK